MRLAVFDLDGTLADTSRDLIAAANAALAEAGYGAPLDAEADKVHAFAGGRAMLRVGMARATGGWDAARVDAAYPRLLAAYAADIARHTRLYPGVVPALDALEAAGWGLAVCTNKPAALAETLLVALHLRPRLRAMLGADSLAVRKPDPLHLLETIARAGGRPDRAVLVGDTANDRDAARAAGVPCVLVSFGPEGDAVASMAPEALLDDYAALPALLDRLVPAA
ncbi:HAD-IA family hydrolase [Amaricoccus sp.]|uniref:HAD-IA family hydrolase n=1 Tax=Amaricoccus sp. TaxID=1872485 RepID=UPI001B5055EB|nr:HAD-IA family hydrolase [Amaricoccus sp.]MBP7002655.1 HAD-IA family hydrolase [Amaricoccus sp.]